MTRAARRPSPQSMTQMRQRLSGQQAATAAIQSASNRQALDERVNEVEGAIPADPSGQLASLEARVAALEP